MVGEAVGRAIVAGLLRRMVRIGLAVGDVAAVNFSICEREQPRGGDITGLCGRATCLLARSAQALSEQMLTCLERRVTFLATRSRRLQQDSARWWRRKGHLNIQCGRVCKAPGGGYALICWWEGWSSLEQRCSLIDAKVGASALQTSLADLHNKLKHNLKAPASNCLSLTFDRA
jgi:hypothetical protein